MKPSERIREIATKLEKEGKLSFSKEGWFLVMAIVNYLDEQAAKAELKQEK